MQNFYVDNSQLLPMSSFSPVYVDCLFVHFQQKLLILVEKLSHSNFFSISNELRLFLCAL